MQKLHVVCFRLILLMQGSYSGMNWISPVWIQTFLVYLGMKSCLYFCLKLVFYIWSLVTIQLPISILNK